MILSLHTSKKEKTKMRRPVENNYTSNSTTQVYLNFQSLKYYNRDRPGRLNAVVKPQDSQR